jgi:effector-binding domain-containing protein
MRFLRILVIIIAVLIVLGLIFLPSAWDIDKSTKINASAEIIFPHVNNLKKFNEWSPWNKLDTAIITTFSGAEEGVGAESEWKSETQGNGRMRIVESTNPTGISTALWFESEFEDEPSLHASFTLNEEEGVTDVHWIIKHDIPAWNIFARMMVFMATPMISETYADGLENLKVLTEKISEEMANIPYSLEISETMAEDMFLLATKDSCSTEHSKISEAFGKNFGKLMKFMGDNKIEMMGMPISVAHAWEPENDRFVFEVALPIAKTKIKNSDGIYGREMKGGNVVVGKQMGPYSEMEKTYNSLMDYMKEKGIEASGMPYEVYANDPTSVEPKDIMTLVNFPVKAK